jgi:hypothetical protein
LASAETASGSAPATPALLFHEGDGVARQLRPPVFERRQCLRLDALAGPWSGGGHAGPIRRGERAVDGLGPGVVGEREEAPVCWDEHTSANELMGAHGLFGAEVPVRPPAPVFAGLHHGHVERAEPLADVLHAWKQSRVARVVRAVRSSDHGKAAPQGSGVADAKGPTRDVPRGRDDEFEIAHARVLPPIELDDVPRRHAPVFEVRTDAERDHEGGVPILHGDDGRAVEVIVVIVRDHHRIDGRQITERDERPVPAPWPGKAHGTDALAPHRIDQDAVPVDFDQEG